MDLKVIPKVKELTKMEKKLQKIYLTSYNLLTAKGLWQAYYPILSIIKLNVNADKMIKNLKLVELHTNYANVFLNKNILKMI